VTSQQDQRHLQHISARGSCHTGSAKQPAAAADGQSHQKYRQTGAAAVQLPLLPPLLLLLLLLLLRHG